MMTISCVSTVVTSLGPNHKISPYPSTTPPPSLAHMYPLAIHFNYSGRWLSRCPVCRHVRYVDGIFMVRTTPYSDIKKSLTLCRQSPYVDGVFKSGRAESGMIC